MAKCHLQKALIVSRRDFLRVFGEPFVQYFYVKEYLVLAEFIHALAPHKTSGCPVDAAPLFPYNLGSLISASCF